MTLVVERTVVCIGFKVANQFRKPAPKSGVVLMDLDMSFQQFEIVATADGARHLIIENRVHCGCRLVRVAIYV